jgi:PAS domain S-box-containing protein
MSEPLRVLVVEDIEDDAVLVLRALRTGGFAPEHRRVETPEAMTAAMEGGPWDIVISDYTMPKFSGLGALALLQKSGLDVPFIVVTGTIGEEEAVRCLHAGASDYLIKDRLERLPSAVERALAAAGERRRLRQAEAELQASEQRHRAILESALDAIVTMDAAGRIVEFSPAAERMFGYTRSEAVGRVMAELIIPPALREKHQRGMARYLAGGQPAVMGRQIEITALRRDGTEFPVELCIQRIDLAGAPFFTGFIRDITERKRAEEKLAASERFLHSLNEATPHWTYVFDLDVMCVTYVNRSILRDLNYPPEVQNATTRLDSFREFMADGEMPHLARMLDEWRVLPDGQIREDEYYLRHADGSTRSFAGREVVFARRPDGTVLQILGALSDITSQKRGEEALRASEERFRDLFEHSPDAIFVESHEGVVLDVNSAACQLHGVARDQLVGRHVLDLVPPAERESVAITFAQLATGDLTKAEGFSWTADSRAVPVEITSNQIVFAGQSAVLLHVRDITERKRVAQALDRERALLRTMIDLLPDYIYIKDIQSRFFLANSSVAHAMGVAGPENLIGKTDGDFFPPEVSAMFRSDEEDVLAGREIFNKEEPVLLPDGVSRFVLTTKVPLRDAAGNIVGLVGIGRDITQRKRAEAAVHSSQQMLKLILDTIPQGVFWKDRDSRYLGCNAVIVRHRGVENAEALMGKTDREFDSVTPEQAESFIQKDREVMAAGKMELGIIEQTTRADGSTRWLETNKVPLFDAAGNVIGVLGTWQDITARKVAEEAVQTSQRMLQLVLDNIPQGVFWKDRESRYLGCNALVARTFGIGNTEDIVGMTDFDFAALTAEQAEFFVRKDREVMDSGQPQLGIIERATFADGATHWLETNKVPLFDTAGNVIGVLGTWQDITERKETEETLQMMRFSVDRAGDSVFWISREGRVLYGNDAACAGRGYSREELLSLTIFDLNPDYDSGVWELRFEELKRRGTITLETRHRAKDGRIFPVEVSANYVFINGQEFNFATVRDLTERRKQERLALRSQRMESIGTLAGGIAHDLNNALAPILMSGELLRMEYPRESLMLGRIEASAQRAAEMVRQLLTFAKGAEGARISVQPVRLIKEMENLIKGSFPKNIHLTVKCDPKLPAVLGDATQLHQVLLNLCVNARDAMPRGGTLTLGAERIEMDEAFASSVPDARPGHYLSLRVCDTGEGIPPEILDRIFDPFFTTKDPDKGTGLGLSTVMGIVKGHGGFTQVYSQPGQGATFIAYLPVDAADSESEPASEPEEKFRGHGETILFVDDEAMVRNVARAVLQHLNFKPLIATDGADGLMQAAQHRTEIRAIITDLHMPRMDGVTFVGEVRLLLPDIPIVVASGRMEDDEAAALAKLGVTGRMDKPFTQAELAEALKNLLAPE